MFFSLKNRSSINSHVRKLASKAPRLHRARVETLESRQLLNALPVIDPIADVSLPGGKPYIMPIVANDADGNPLSYSFYSSNPAIKVQLHKGNPYLRLTVQNYGAMAFQLLRDLAPKTVDNISGLVKGEYYNGLTFHRITNLAGSGSATAYIVQGGDIYGTGSGPSPITYDDEFNLGAIFSSKGQLAMANSGADTNGTQFFITAAPTRFLDFNHTIFGQLVRGFDVLNLLTIAAVDSDGKPQSFIVITKAEIIQDPYDAVITLSAPAGASGAVTVYANDPNGGGDSKTFNVTTVTDTTNEPPYLAPIPTSLFTPVNTPIDIPLSSIDMENNPGVFGGQWVGDSASHATGTILADGKTVRITPEAGYRGIIQFKARLFRDTIYANQGSDDDGQVITIAVGDKAIKPAKARTFKATAGVSGTFTAAAFRDTDLKGKPTDFTASINWGDSQVSAGTITSKNGYFYVSGTTAYRAEGSFPVTVTITGKLGGASQTIAGNASVADAPITITPAIIIGYPNTDLTDISVLTFTDADPRGQLSDFSASIDWGDGETSAATITKSGKVYTLAGTHRYTTAGSKPISVQVFSVGGTLTTANVTARIARPSLIVEGGPDITSDDSYGLYEGVYFNRQITFSDSESGYTYTATVNWGDGSPLETLVISDNTINLNHEFVNSGTYKAKVIVTDNTGATGSDTINLVVKNTPPSVDIIGGDTNGVCGQKRTITFTGSDPSPVDSAGLYYLVDWGDGSSVDTLATTTASHTYAAVSATSYTVKVTASDPEGMSGSQSSQMTIVAAQLQTDPIDSTKKVLVVGGTSAADSILLRPAVNNQVEVFFAGVSAGVFAPTSRIQVFGGDGSDLISLVPGIRIPAELYGGVGNDTLYGGQGNDIIVGGAGDDSIYGDAGRDLLIGGAGKDTIIGGNGDDLLVAGTTFFDGDSVALNRLMSEWTRTDQTYVQRLTHLTTRSAGLNTRKALLTSRTIIDDTDLDSLTGQKNYDVFYSNTDAATTQDAIVDRAGAESVVAI